MVKKMFWQKTLFHALSMALLASQSRSTFGRAFAIGSSTQTKKAQLLVDNSAQKKNALLHQRQRVGFPTSLSLSSAAIDIPNGGDAADDKKTKNLPIKKLVGGATALTSVALFIINFASLLQAYESSLLTKPLPTKVITGASLAAMGDYLAQVKEKKDNYDVPRAVSFAMFDSCYRMFQHVAIPVIKTLGTGHIFHSILSKIPFSKPTMAFTSAMECTFLYQFLLIPFFYYPIFFTFTGLMQGLSIKETIERAKKNFLPCWKRNLIFWIPMQMVMFGLIVERWQIPFVCVMGILWSLILSATAGKAKTTCVEECVIED